MIICLESSILSGYLSNEVPGLVTGLLHLAGSPKSLRVELEGDFLRDIAGCRVDFHNPCPEADPALLDALQLAQTGHAGLMTGSYRVAILPRRRTARQAASGPALRVPSGLKNLVFFEWFNAQGQRVLMQSWHLMLRVSAPRWQLDRDEEKRLLRQARARRRHHILESRRQREESGDGADPFTGDLLDLPPDAEAGEDPFGGRPVTPRSRHKKSILPKEPAAAPLPDPFQRSEALAAELRRFESLLIYQNDLNSQPAMLKLLATVADLAAHLGHALRQFVISRRENWDFLIVDLEQSLPLFGAALSATERLVRQPAGTVTDRNWLNTVQSCLFSIELRMRELLTLLR